MPYTRTSIRKTLKIALLFVILALIIFYAVWRSLNYARGPEISIEFPPNKSATTSPMIRVYGRADRVNRVKLNGRDITTDEQGHFGEILTVFKGTNLITIEATDQFGRAVKKELLIAGEQEVF